MIRYLPRVSRVIMLQVRIASARPTPKWSASEGNKRPKLSRNPSWNLFSFNSQFSAEDWIFVCVVKCEIKFSFWPRCKNLLSCSLSSACYTLHLFSKSTCKNETMKEAKTIAQARQPPSFGDPTSITCLLSATSLNRVLVWENKEIYQINSAMLSVGSCTSCHVNFVVIVAYPL